jgi:hypothetical protein
MSGADASPCSSERFQQNAEPLLVDLAACEAFPRDSHRCVPNVRVSWRSRYCDAGATKRPACCVRNVTPRWGPASLLEPRPVLSHIRGGLGSSRQAELIEDPADVVLYRLLGKKELLPDLAIGMALG